MWWLIGLAGRGETLLYMTMFLLFGWRTMTNGHGLLFVLWIFPPRALGYRSAQAAESGVCVSLRRSPNPASAPRAWSRMMPRVSIVVFVAAEVQRQARYRTPSRVSLTRCSRRRGDGNRQDIPRGATASPG